MTIEVHDPPTFGDMQELFEMMNPAELQRCADYIIADASPQEVADRYYELREPRNTYEDNPGIVTYGQV